MTHLYFLEMVDLVRSAVESQRGKMIICLKKLKIKTIS